MAFWGLVLEPGKRYSTTVENTFHISKAVLDISSADTISVSVMLQEGNSSYILCHLHSKNEPQTDLDLNFATGDKITLFCKGSGIVHLSGYMVTHDEDDLLKPDDEDVEGDISMNIADEEEDSDKLMSDEETEEDEDESKEEESDEEVLPPKKKLKPDSKHKKQFNGESKQLVEIKAKKEGKAVKMERKDDSLSEKSTQSRTDASRVLSGGLTIKDIQVGNGPVAQPGKKAVVYYTGRLKSNNKIFDSCKKGSGFKFNVGKGEVIKGWDLGVAGMKVGGKRVITCPPQMAYGAKGAPPDVPPNSTLVFIVELKAVN